MDLYSSFAGFIEVITSPGEIVVDDNLFGEHPWLTLIIEPVFLYGSLPRPPDLQSPVVLPSFLMDCSILLQSPMVCVWIMHSISHQLSSGTVYCCVPHEPCIDSKDSFRHPKHSRQGEIWLDSLMQNHQLVIAPRCLELNGVGVISEIVPALCCVDEFIHLVSMVSEAVLKMLLVFRGLRVMDIDGYGLSATDVAIQILQLIAEEFPFCSTKDTKLRKFILELLERFGFVGWNHVSTLLKLSLKLSPDIGDLQLDVSSYHLFDVNIHPVSLQSRRQDYDLIRQTIVAHSGWFGSILEFLYGSLPRPPDVLYVFSSQPYNSHGMCLDSRRSVSGVCVFLGNSLITWKSKNPDVVSNSRTEAEYRSMAVATKELLWLHQMLTDLHITPLHHVPFHSLLGRMSVSSLFLTSSDGILAYMYKRVKFPLA